LISLFGLLGSGSFLSQELVLLEVVEVSCGRVKVEDERLNVAFGAHLTFVSRSGS